MHHASVLHGLSSRRQDAQDPVHVSPCVVAATVAIAVAVGHPKARPDPSLAVLTVHWCPEYITTLNRLRSGLVSLASGLLDL